MQVTGRPLLRDVDEQWRLRMAGITVRGRRRRPSGQARIPRRLTVGAKLSLLALAACLLWLVGFWLHHPGPVDRIDAALLQTVTAIRSGPLDTLAAKLHALGSTRTLRGLWMPTAIVLVVSQRWRHLATYVGVIYLTVAAARWWLPDAIARPRPFDGVIIGTWSGFALPSWPVAGLAVTATATVFVLLTPGRRRRLGFAAVALLVLLLSLARVYQAVDHPSDAASGAILGVAAAVLAFRLIAPDADFPVTYSTARRAHLKLEGERRERIRTALGEQLGVDLLEIEPFRLAGSAGSTPSKLRVAGRPEGLLFGKLYATSHLRSDRWYKLGRVLMYGALEDEAPFASVRRLAEHEDYLLRLCRDNGVQVPRPYGVVEIVPEREYLLVTELVEDTVELVEATVDDTIIDDALRQVRRLWDSGIGHRDIKPSNVLVRGGQVFLVDVAFGELRPTGWRQAVDLANMMLTLALRADPRRVYERARQFFDAQDIAGAFAATGSVTIPRQLRRLLKDDGRDPLGQFRRLAPEHRPIAIQRWSVNRIRLAAGAASGLLLALLLIQVNLHQAGLL